MKNIISIFEVTKSSVYLWISKYKKTGNYTPMPPNSGRKSKLTNKQLEQIRERISEQPDITLDELKEQLNLPICISALCRIINNKLGLSYKKNSTCKRTKQARCRRNASRLDK